MDTETARPDHTPIYAELVEELSPDTGDWGISRPPEFASELADKAFNTRRQGRSQTKSTSRRAKKQQKQAAQCR